MNNECTKNAKDTTKEERIEFMELTLMFGYMTSKNIETFIHNIARANVDTMDSMADEIDKLTKEKEHLMKELLTCRN